MPSVSFSDLIGEVAGHVPVEIGRAGRLRADDAHRRALRVRRQHAHDARRDADVDAAGDHGLLRLAAALRPEDLEHEAVLLEDAGTLADFRDRRVPVAALPGRDLERVLRVRRLHGKAERKGGEHAGNRWNLSSMHPPDSSASAFAMSGGGNRAVRAQCGVPRGGRQSAVMRGAAASLPSPSRRASSSRWSSARCRRTSAARHGHRGGTRADRGAVRRAPCARPRP